MHRIDGPGFAPGNLWTEGNPGLLIPATVVTDDWMNDAQEEIVNVIEGQGITLVKGTQTQLQDAINSMIAGGGGPGSGIQQTIVNNQGAPLDITGLIFDLATVKAGKFTFDLVRRTDSSSEVETGEGYVSYDVDTSLWKIAITSNFDDCGVTFSIDNISGQVKYISDNLPGTSYAGTMRIIDIKKILLTLP